MTTFWTYTEGITDSAHAREIARREYAPVRIASAKADRLACQGLSLVVGRFVSYCPWTDTTLGVEEVVLHAAPTRAAAEAWVAAHPDEADEMEIR